VTPSAVSQRIKALEQRVGQVLVVREKPCAATAAGIPLLRLAAQTALLEAEALAEMGGGDGSAPRIALAVNADSISTWFTGVLAALDDVLFDIRIEDQDHSARLLREGAVMGAVTTERTPVPGCRVQPLGVMRYVAVASPEYIKRYLADGFTAHAMSEVPSLAWNRDDALQDMLVRKAFRRDIARPQHLVPIAEGFGAAVRNGRGGGCFLIASQRRILTTAHSCGSQMRTSTSRCTGSAGTRQPDRRPHLRSGAFCRYTVAPTQVVSLAPALMTSLAH